MCAGRPMRAWRMSAQYRLVQVWQRLVVLVVWQIMAGSLV